MVNRLLRAWLLLGWWPVGYLACILNGRRWKHAAVEYLFLGIFINAILVLALNYIINKKVTLWYSEIE